MSDPVKPDLRAARVAATEEKILNAATELFVRHGYAGTTLAAVADHARVGARTVYVRFGTKAALLKRAVDVAFAGDTAPVDVRHRDWFARAETAPTAAERVAALATGSSRMLARAGDVLAVALEAAATEPELAAAAQAGREATRANIAAFWTKMADDGLLPGGRDLGWLTDTASLLVHAETYLLARDMMGWTPDAHERWLTTSLTALISADPASPPPPGHPAGAP
ncbi:TetR/AcrR family transcriptional regulator [Actinomadura decatromicini]|uniref:TetR/AcrR family transcriptional regulator n=1 Tax=Actinomadura decatromicini TaxID=2604572 RepID=A0A5D3FQB9_9ACTN|nr:TetR/AcrR family transcriptional regulator [Actinomadura decatromicini]TYK50551.1 TetR/AcrR family transcriptional regulator [Actinomadura decatromicini]